MKNPFSGLEIFYLKYVRIYPIFSFLVSKTDLKRNFFESVRRLAKVFVTYHMNTLFEIELSTLFPGTVQLILVLKGCLAGTHLQYDNLHTPLCSAITKTISAWSANNAGRRDILPRWSATNRALRPSCTD